MNNKGFTLIELIATIALLAIMALISFVSITKVLENRKTNDCKTLIENIKIATKEYVSDNRYNNVDSSKITIDMLKENNYLKGNITNPYTGDDVDSSSIKISVTLNENYTVKDVLVEGLECNS